MSREDAMSMGSRGTPNLIGRRFRCVRDLRPARGLSLVELVALLALCGLGLLITLPALAALRTSGRTAAAARELAVLLQAQRWKSVSRNVVQGLSFELRGRSWVWTEVQDGNGNGLRSLEVRNGIDPKLGAAERLEDRDGLVRFGFPSFPPIPRIPPDRGVIVNRDDPIQFGRSDLVSFSPLGSSSSGTLYLTDGRDELFAVVLFGPSSRVRVWRYDRGAGRWKL